MKFLCNRNICIARTVRSISLVGGAVGYKKLFNISIEYKNVPVYE